jgi:hypothetical protein
MRTHHPLPRVAVAAIALAGTLVTAPAEGQQSARLDIFRGAGAWVDIYDYAQWKDPEGTVAQLAARGVQTLYLESTSYRRKGPIRYPERTARFLDAAHAASIPVVAWYVPGFADLEKDFDWSMAAINFQTAAGHRFDAFGLDIEVTVVTDPVDRARRVVELSEAIRAAVGPSYPMAAIVVSPMRSPGYWPVFPDPEIAALYDVYMPMSYWTFRVNGEKAAYHYIAETVRRSRERTGRVDLPIHVIGGEAMHATPREMAAFVRAVKGSGVLGASIYDVAGFGGEEWSAIEALRWEPKPTANPEEEKGQERLRFGVDLGAYGRIPGMEPRRKVVFGTGPLRGDWELDYEGFDLGDGEVAMVVNGQRVADLAPTDKETWGTRRTLAVDGRFLRPDGGNVFEFVPTAGLLAEGTWGIRRASLVAGPLPLGDGAAHGLLPGAEDGRSDRVTYGFTGEGEAMSLRVEGFDLIEDEVRVLLNGQLVAVLAATPEGTWGPSQTILLPDLRVGENRLILDSLPNPYRQDPWGVRLTDAAPAALV